KNAIYRPFTKQNLYYHKPFIERPGLTSKLFPDSNTFNAQIVVTGTGANKDFSVLMTNTITSLDAIEKGQAFPLYFYEEREKQNPSLFDTDGNSEYIQREAVSDF